MESTGTMYGHETVVIECIHIFFFCMYIHLLRCDEMILKKPKVADSKHVSLWKSPYSFIMSKYQGINCVCCKCFSIHICIYNIHEHNMN